MIYWSRTIQVSGTQYGALVVYSGDWHGEGKTATIYALDSKNNKSQVYYATVKFYTADDGSKKYAAVFPSLPPGNYEARIVNWGDSGKTTVFPGMIAEVTVMG